MRTPVRAALAAAAATGALILAPSLASAKVRITVDLDAQTLHAETATQVYDWKVSSGKNGYDTPAGKFGVLWMDKDHHSDEYEQAPMPNAIFFAPGYAIHGFTKSAWGHKASHGCIRLPVDKSAILFSAVKAEGAEITVTGVSTETIASVRAKLREKTAEAAPADAATNARGLAARGDGDQGYADQGYAAQGYAQSDEGQGYGYSQDGYGYARRPRAVRSGGDGLFGSVY